MKIKTHKDWIFVSTGQQFWPTKPKVEDIDIEWIAHGLSNLCRFCGHVKTFYSVAQHSVLVSRILPEYDLIKKIREGKVKDLGRRIALAKLFHDAPEAVISDVVRPVKYIPEFAKVYNRIENKILKCMYKKFNISWLKIIQDEVKRCDDILCLTEIRDLIKDPYKYFKIPVDAKLLGAKIKPVSPKTAKKMFLSRYEEIIRYYV